MTITTLLYVDPTGGLPPPIWGMMLAAILGALTGFAAILKLWGKRIAHGARTHAKITRRRALFLFLATGSTMAFFWFKRKNTPITQGRSAVTAPRVLILAFDGLDPLLLNQYLADGRLPHFQRLAQQGLYHPLATSLPPQSPVAWSTFLTGDPPTSHGVRDFIHRNPKNYLPDLSIADRHNLKLPWTGTPIWSLPAIAKLGFTAHRLPMTFPPPKVNGRLLAGMGVWDMRGTEGTYFFYTSNPKKFPHARGFILPLTPLNNTHTGELPGPYRVNEADTLREPFTLSVATDHTTATLTIQNHSHKLTPNRWSDWISVEFAMGVMGMQKARGVTRVLLTVTPDDGPALYVSPLQFDPRSPMYTLSYPRSWSAELADSIGLYATRGIPFDSQAVNDGVLSDQAFLDQVEAITDESERMLFLDLPRFESGVLFSYFLGSDVVQHMFWRGIDEQHPLHHDADTQRHLEAIPRFYERCDAILGRALAAMNNQGAVVVISDHGFAPFRRAVHINAILRDLGWLVCKENKRTSGELMADVDWSRTRAYAVGLNAVYLNVKGREAQGIIEAANAPAAAKELAAALEQWTDPDNQQHPIKRAYIQPTGEVAPDLILGYIRGYRASWETALGAAPEKTVEPNAKKWSGDHCIDPDEVPGIFLSNDQSLDAQSLATVGAAVNQYLEKQSPR